MKSQYLKTGIEGVNGRREFLKLAGYGALGLMAGSYLPMVSPSAYGLNQEAPLKTAETGFKPYPVSNTHLRAHETTDRIAKSDLS